MAPGFDDEQQLDQSQLAELEAIDGWQRLTDEPEIRGVEVTRRNLEPRRPDETCWVLTVWVAEFLREEPLRRTLEQSISRSVGAVNGVLNVMPDDRETWIVIGEPDGQTLLRAACTAVYRLADQARSHIEGRWRVAAGSHSSRVEDTFWQQVDQAVVSLGFVRQGRTHWARSVDDFVTTCLFREQVSIGGSPAHRISWSYSLPAFTGDDIVDPSPCGPAVAVRSIVDFCDAPPNHELSLLFAENDMLVEISDPLGMSESEIAELGLSELMEPSDSIRIEGIDAASRFVVEVLHGPFETFTSRYGSVAGLLELLNQNRTVAQEQLGAPFFASRPDRFIRWLEEHR